MATLHPTKLILLNGPPRSGKDTAARFFARKYNAKVIALATPLRNIVREMFGVSDLIWRDLVLEKLDKADPQLCFGGKSFREVQIEVATFIRATYGDDFFIMRCITELQRSSASTIAVISDVGFQIEADLLSAWARPHNTMLLQLEKSGTSFDVDSRSYVNIPHGVHAICIDNRHDLELYEMQLQRAIDAWMTRFPQAQSQVQHNSTKR